MYDDPVEADEAGYSVESGGGESVVPGEENIEEEFDVWGQCE